MNNNNGMNNMNNQMGTPVPGASGLLGVPSQMNMRENECQVSLYMTVADISKVVGPKGISIKTIRQMSG